MSPILKQNRGYYGVDLDADVFNAQVKCILNIRDPEWKSSVHFGKIGKSKRKTTDSLKQHEKLSIILA